MDMADPDLINYLSAFITEERLSAFERVLAKRTRYISVVLEDIYQAHNASAVLRTCDCFGIQDVHVIERRNNYSVSRGVALGSDKWLTISRHSGSGIKTSDVYTGLREKGYRIVATTPHQGDVTLNSFDLTKGKVALIFGTELNGLTEEAISEADEYLKIPMLGFTESFNISVSAAIILNHLSDNLRSGDIDWNLTDEESAVLKLEWLKKSIKSAEQLERKFYLMK